MFNSLIIMKQEYRVTLEYCIKLLESDEPRDKIRNKLHFLFSFDYNLDVFCKFFLPKAFYKPFAKFHYEIMDEFNKKSNSVIAVPRAHGKQLADKTPILTKNGWKNHGDLKVGDYVFHPSGKPIKVISISTKTNSDYLVYFKNGEIIRCHGNHEWEIFDRFTHKTQIYETKFMVGKEKYIEEDKLRNRFLIRTKEPVELKEQSLEIDPYFLGLWLGNGTSSAPRLSYHEDDTEILKWIPYKISTHLKNGLNNKSVVTTFSHQGLMGKLRKLNLWKNKHIPDSYLINSYENRMKLLAGLIDSDGSYSVKRNRFRFVNTNKRIIDGMVKLISSLGLRPYITSQEPKTHDNIIGKKKVYTLAFRNEIDIPTRLKRKQAVKKYKKIRLGITKVEYKPNGEKGNCIQVDSEDGLYLVGNQLHTTHNSSLVGKGITLKKICYKEERYIIYGSRNNDLSKMFLGPIKGELKHNSRLRLVYPNIDIRNVKDKDTGLDRQDCFDIGKEMRIQAYSFEKNARGLLFENQRPTLFILDDIDEDSRVRNPTLRNDDWDKINKVIIPGLDPEVGKFKAIGTVIHLDSMLKRLISVYKGKIFRAYEVDENDKIIPESILFPDLFSVEFFENYIEKSGSLAASSEYLNNPIDDVFNLIKRKWVKSSFCEDLTFFNSELKYDIKIQGVDFAFSDRVSADKSAFVGIGRNEECIDVISCITKKGMSVIEQFDFIAYLTGVYSFNDNALEENSIRSMSKEINDYKFPFTLFWTGASDPAVGEKDYKKYDYSEKRHTVGKVSMIKRLATTFENNFNSVRDGEGHKLRIPYMTEKDKIIAHLILDECCSYALQDGKLVESGVHPDIPIALQLAFEDLSRHHSEDVCVEW